MLESLRSQFLRSHRYVRSYLERVLPLRSSWAVLIKDKHLIVFPIVSGFLFLIVLASFAVPLATLVDWNKFQQQLQANNNRPPIWVYALSFAFYFSTYFVIIFCNSALISCAMMRFNGQEPSVGDGFRMAMSRLPQIFAWALVSATVGVLLKVIENSARESRLLHLDVTRGCLVNHDLLRRASAGCREDRAVRGREPLDVAPPPDVG